MEEQTPNPIVHKANIKQRQRRPATRRMLEELQQVSEEIMRSRNGKLFEDSAEMIRQERDKRTRYLMQVTTDQYGEDPCADDTDTLKEQP